MGCSSSSSGGIESIQYIKRDNATLPPSYYYSIISNQHNNTNYHNTIASSGQRRNIYGSVGFVLKTTTVTNASSSDSSDSNSHSDSCSNSHRGKKVFINILYHELVASESLCNVVPAEMDYIDRKGNVCAVYNCIVNTQVLQQSILDGCKRYDTLCITYIIEFYTHIHICTNTYMHIHMNSWL